MTSPSKTNSTLPLLKQWYQLKPDTRRAWLFLLPCFLGLSIFTYVPVLMSLGLSFSYWNLLGTPHWVGLENYSTVIHDPLFWKSIQNTVLFVIAVTILEVVLGLMLAVWLNKIKALRTLLRTAYFLPFITPMVSVALVWSWIYEPEYGMLNWILHSLGLIQENIAWLYDKRTALFAVVLLQVWKSIGYNMVIFIAGLQAIPDSLYESADLDGASFWESFKNITLPLVSPTTFFVVTVSLINGFQVFDSIYLLTQGGPQHSTELLVYWMFKNAFAFYKIGPASAIAYILFIIILVLTLVQWRLRTGWVLHENEPPKKKGVL